MMILPFSLTGIFLGHVQFQNSIQLDPERRGLLQLGFNPSLRNDGPSAAFAAYIVWVKGHGGWES